VVGPHGFFRRFRLICGGQVIEDIDNYNRTCEMFKMMNAEDKPLNDAIEGFGGTITSTPTSLGAGAERVVTFTPFLGFKIKTHIYQSAIVLFNLNLNLYHLLATQIRTAGNASSTFTISDAELTCDVITLDNALDNEHVSHLISGRSLPINLSSHATNVQAACSTGKQNVNLARALTRMKSVCVTMFKDPSDSLNKEGD
jgi:hypothetical protein